VPNPTPYTVGGIDVSAGSALTVQIPPRTFLGRMTGLLFDTDKTFLLPRSLAGIRGLRRFLDQHPGVQVLVVGHTDTVGAAQYNLTLSIERAHSIAAYLQDDVDAWMEYYPGRPGSAHWGTVEDQHMLKELGFHAGEITGNPADSRDAVARFQTSKNLTADGRAGQNTRRALVTSYMQLEGTTLPAGTIVKTHGCGKFHLEVKTGDNVDEQRNRRVEVFFFENRIDPPPRPRCPAPGCPEYPEWRRRTVQTFDLEHPPGTLEVTVKDPQGGIVASASVHASGPTVADGQTDGSGRVRFADLIPGTYTVLGQRQGFRDGTVQTQVAEQTQARAGSGGASTAVVNLGAATGDLTVRVLDNGGRAISGASVTVTPALGLAPAVQTTDGQGNANFSGLQAGSVRISATATDFATGNGNSTVAANASTATTLTLTASVGNLDVQVQDNLGAAIPGADVTVVPAPAGAAAAPKTDAQGRAGFTRVPVGSVTITVRKSGFRDGTATATITPGGLANVPLVLQPTAVDVTVQVVSNTGVKLSGATVNVDGPLSISGTTDANGVVIFRLAPGRHQIAATLANFTSPPAVAVDVVTTGSNGVTITLTANNLVATISALPLLVVLRKHNCSPARKQVRLGVNGSFSAPGTGRFTRSINKVRFFTAATAGTEITFNGTDNVFTAAQLTAGVQLFAEGGAVSTSQEDTDLKIELLVGTNPIGTPAAGKGTCVDLTVELFQSRPAPTTDPAPMAVNDKTDVGRFVHLQDPGFHHRRARLVVREVQPAKFAKDLELRVVPGLAGTGAVQFFPTEDHVAGEVAVGLPHTVTAADLSGAPQVAGRKGVALFAEGLTVSSGLRTVVLQLGIRGDAPDGDRAAFTVVRLSSLSVTIPSTDANTVRLANGGIPASALTLGTGAAPTAREHDEAFAGNAPIVLVENSIAAGTPIVVGVNVAPPGVPVRLATQRVTNAADKDKKEIVDSLVPAPAADHPTLNQTSAVGAAPIRGNLVANSVGSFHIRAFVDGNGNGTFDDRGEPFIVMNCVLVRVQGSSNSSASVNTNWGFGSALGARPAPGAAFSATAASGLRLVTGGFANGPIAATHNDAVVNLIGGGPNGLVGLDSVFLGWVNNELDAGTGTRPNASGEDVVSTYTDPAPPGAVHSRISVMTSPQGVFPVGGPAPVLVAGPVLDVSPFGNEGQGGNLCVGTEGAVGPPIAHPQAAPVGTPGGVGKSIRVEMWDSPGDRCPPRMAAFPAAVLTSYRFNIDFRSDLVVWTNIVTKAAPPTPGPTVAGSPAPDIACCVYATVLTNQWNIRFNFNFGVAPVPVPPGAVTMTPDPTVNRIAAPIVRPSTEVRFPIGLNLLGIQERP